MPRTNTLKQFGEGEIYHIYNRGFDQQTIFHDRPDFAKFIELMERYLTVEISGPKLLAYCLMTNHFHFLMQLIDTRGISLFMKRLAISYTHQYNKKYVQRGSLFEAKYRAVRVVNDNQLQHLTRYIHRNPVAITPNFESYEYSSCRYYLHETPPPWLTLPKSFSEMSPAQYKTFLHAA